jgi:hypothetical protein
MPESLILCSLTQDMHGKTVIQLQHEISKSLHNNQVQ